MGYRTIVTLGKLREKLFLACVVVFFYWPDWHVLLLLFYYWPDWHVLEAEPKTRNGFLPLERCTLYLLLMIESQRVYCVLRQKLIKIFACIATLNRKIKEIGKTVHIVSQQRQR